MTLDRAGFDLGQVDSHIAEFSQEGSEAPRCMTSGGNNRNFVSPWVDG